MLSKRNKFKMFLGITYILSVMGFQTMSPRRWARSSLTRYLDTWVKLFVLSHPSLHHFHWIAIPVWVKRTKAYMWFPQAPRRHLDALVKLLRLASLVKCVVARHSCSSDFCQCYVIKNQAINTPDSPAKTLRNSRLPPTLHVVWVVWVVSKIHRDSSTSVRCRCAEDMVTVANVKFGGPWDHEDKVCRVWPQQTRRELCKSIQVDKGNLTISFNSQQSTCTCWIW
jgi:hypothetical protein